MKIHKELLELSRKADKIIHASIDFNLDMLKSFKEKALAIMACKSVEDLKNLTKTAEPEKKFQKFEIPLQETKVHLHSNKSSFASTSGSSDQNIADNSSELQTNEVYNYQQSSNSSHRISDRKFSTENLNSKDDTFQKKTNKTDEFVVKNTHSETSQQSFNTKISKEGESENIIKFNNFHSFTKTSSESSTSKQIGSIYSTTNFQFEKHRSIDIMEKIEESSEEIISNKFVTVSTMIKTSYRKSSNENFEENKRNVHINNTYSGQDKETVRGSSGNNIVEKFKENDERIVSEKLVTVSTIIKTSYPKSSNDDFEAITENEGETGDDNLNSGNDNFTALPIDMFQLQFENTYNTDNIQSDEILLNKNNILAPSKVNCSTDFGFSNGPGLIQTRSDNVSQNLEFEEFNPANILDACKMNLVNHATNVNHSNVTDNAAQFFTKVPSWSQKPVRDSQSMDVTKTKILENILVPSRITDEGEAVDSNVSHNLKSKNITEMDCRVQTLTGKNNTEVNYKKNKFSKKKNIQSKNFLAVSTIPVLIENKASDSRKLNDDAKITKKPRMKRSLLPKSSRSYNLRSAKNNLTLKTNFVNQIKSSKLGLNKNLSLKEEVEVKKKLREQKMKLIRERRENLEKERRERRRLSEERRIKRFEQHEEVLKRKIMDVKNKVKYRKLRKQFCSSSEVSPEGNIEDQSLQAGSDRTYLVENLTDISPIEPTEKAQVRSSGEGLNYSLLYNSEYDRKIFMRQSVVLQDISQLMPPGTLQNCLNLSQNKETKPIWNGTPNSTSHKVSKRKLSTIEKNCPSTPAKKPMRSTRKLSVSSNYIMRNQATKEGRSIEKGDSMVLKLTPLQFAKAKDNSEMAEKLLSDPKLSMKTSVVLEKISKSKLEEPIYSKIKTSTEPMKEKASILSGNAIKSKHNLSTLSPLVVLKDISNTGSNLPRSTKVKSKTVKVHFSDNTNENDPKLLGIIRKGLFNSKSCTNNADKKLEKNTKKETNKKRKQDCLENNKPRKKVLVTKKTTPEKQKKFPSLSSKRIEKSDTSSYEISDISDNSISIVEQKAKKIPSWASNIHLKQAILKQHYGPQDPDAIFGNFKNQKAIDLAVIFPSDKIKYHTRTSSAKWSADESPI